MEEYGNNFHYHLSEGWKSIESPFDPTETDFNEQLKRLGYFEHATFTVGDVSSFSVEWHTPTREGCPPFPYLMIVSDGSSLWQVFASDFPSAIDVLHKFASIAQAGLVHDVYDETEATRFKEFDKTEERQREIARKRKERSLSRAS
ncbi:MAG TPA: hypothetical protein VN956_03765 [Pyrinomonadaceae bacterium]|nr:hypothetical protein [Pyrinomonadaceae bacterium]